MNKIKLLLSILVQPITYGWFLIIFLFIMFPISILAAPFKQTTRLKLTAPAWKLFFHGMLNTVFICKVYKEDLRDEKSKSRISPHGLYIANHQSFADLPLMMSNIIIPPIMKKEILYIPILGLCAYASGGIVVDRKSHDSRKKVFEKAKTKLTTQNKHLQYFPEGTRTLNGDDPKPFSEIKTTLMSLAYDENIEVYPISMRGTEDIISKYGKINLFKRIGIILHPSIHPKDFDTKESFMETCWETVTKGSIELRTKIHS